MEIDEQKAAASSRTFDAEHIQKILSPHETWIMRIQSLLVWEKPIYSAVFLLFFNFMFWLFAISNYRFFFVLGTCLLVFFVSHSWLTKIWPEIKVPIPAEEQMSEEWTYVHPVLLNIPELSQLLARTLTAAVSFHDHFWLVRRTKPGRFCLYCSSLCICGFAAGWCFTGRLLVYFPAIVMLLWPSVSYHSLLTRFYQKFKPFFSQLDNSMDIRRSHHRSRRHPQVEENLLVAEDSDTDLDDFIPGDFVKPVNVERLAATGFESGGSSCFSSRSHSPFEPNFDHRGSSTSQIGAPDLALVYTPSGGLEADESSLSLLPGSIPSLDEMDNSGTWGRRSPPVQVPPTKGQRRRKVKDVLTDSSDDDNAEETLALGLEVPDLQNVPADDATTPNYLASVAGQTLTQIGLVGAIGLSRLAEYMKAQENQSTVEIEELLSDDDEATMARVREDAAMLAGSRLVDSDREDSEMISGSGLVDSDREDSEMISGSGLADFEFIEHEDVPAMED